MLDYWDLIWFPVALIYFIINYPQSGNSNLIITNSFKWWRSEESKATERKKKKQLERSGDGKTGAPKRGASVRQQTS